MTTSATIATVCVHCGAKDADAQTGRCLSCGKLVISPSIASEFGHPTLDQPRHSPSASYRNGHEEPPQKAVEEGAASSTPPRSESTGSSASATEPPPVSPEVVKRAAACALAPAETPLPLVTFRLPDSPSTTKWIIETRALRDKLIAQAERAETQIAELKAEAARNRASADAFSKLLEGIAIGDKPAAAEPPPTPITAASSARKPAGKWSKNASACIDCGRSDIPHYSLDRCQACYQAKRRRDAGAQPWS